MEKTKFLKICVVADLILFEKEKNPHINRKNALPDTLNIFFEKKDENKYSLPRINLIKGVEIKENLKNIVKNYLNCEDLPKNIVDFSTLITFDSDQECVAKIVLLGIDKTEYPNLDEKGVWLDIISVFKNNIELIGNQKNSLANMFFPEGVDGRGWEYV